MLDPFPGHVGNVQQSVNTAQIDERAVICQILHNTLDLLTFLQALQQSFTLDTVFFFQHRSPGDHNIVALRIKFDDLEFEFLTLQVISITLRTDIHQGTRQERSDVLNFHRKATFHATADRTGDDLLRRVHVLQQLPCLRALGFLSGQPGLSPAIVDSIHGDLNGIANGDVQLTFFVDKLGSWNDALCLQTRVDCDPVAVDIDHGAGHDGSDFHIEVFQTLFK